VSPTIRSQPDTDLTPLEWADTPSAGSHVSKIDETIAAKDNTDFIVGKADLDDEDEHGYPADSPADMDEVTLVDMELYYKGVQVGGPGNEPTLTITLYVGAVSKGARTFDASSGGAWITASFKVTPSPVLSKADYDSLDIRYKAGKGSGDTPE